MKWGWTLELLCHRCPQSPGLGRSSGSTLQKKIGPGAQRLDIELAASLHIMVTRKKNKNKKMDKQQTTNVNFCLEGLGTQASKVHDEVDWQPGALWAEGFLPQLSWLSEQHDTALCNPRLSSFVSFLKNTNTLIVCFVITCKNVNQLSSVFIFVVLQFHICSIYIHCFLTVSQLQSCCRQAK